MLRKLFAVSGLLALFVVSVAAATETAQPTLACKAGEGKTIDVGIVKAIGCWTKESKDGANIYTARFADQPNGEVDLNGFLVGSAYRGNGALRVNDSTNRVTGVSLDGGPKVIDVQLRSLNVPVSGSKTDLGGGVKLDFVAPNFGELVIEDLRLGSNSAWARALAGFIPGNAEVPITIGEDGKGTMHLVVEATGSLALKGKPQSVRINVETESGKGTELDGFEFSLNEVSVGRYLTVNNLNAFFSASKREWGGNAEASWPFPRPSGSAGFKIGFTMTNGSLRRLQVGVNGLMIPIGTAGVMKSLSGGFEVSPNGADDGIQFNVGAGAAMGPPMWTPSGGVGDRPIGVNATLTAGRANGSYFVKVNGDMSFMNVPLGDAYMGIYFDAGADFGAAMGLGLPSFRNNPNDPFYIGTRIDGWIGNGFQLEGGGRLSVFGWRLSDTNILVSNKVIGACAEVLWTDVGGVYEYGRGLELFGSSCGLKKYRQKFAGSSVASVSAPRTIRLDREEVMLAVKGDGAAPRFRLISPDGRVIATPDDRDAVVREDNAFFIDEENHVTNVIPPRGPGEWKLAPLPGSADVVQVTSSRELPPEKVNAKVVGRGIDRTLVWNSAGGPDTTLSFSEEMPGGRDRHILSTGKKSGRFKFTPGYHGNYGERRLKLIVMHNDSPRETKVVNTYRVERPSPLRAPSHVRAYRDDHEVTVKWSGVKPATGYLVTTSIKPKNGKRVTFARKVGPKARSVVFKGSPGAAWATARVFALNIDGRPGRAKAKRFRPGPAIKKLDPAAQAGLDSARATGKGVVLRTVCPTGGHCQLRLKLLLNGRTVATSRYQQAPDTFHRALVVPKDPAVLRKLAAPRPRGFALDLRQSRTAGHGTDSGRVR
ncbi:MAG TPA: hypothetical protein VMF31_03650 [Solirubrobacterales bacterium]|nr:hypothetical protein [Solirubrobacterales bacterium]